MIKATFDGNGYPTAFYDLSLFDYDVPEDAIEITTEQRDEFINNQGQRRFVAGAVVEVKPEGKGTESPPPLSAPQFWQAALVIGVTEEGLSKDVLSPESPLYVSDAEERESVLIDIKKTTLFSRDHYLVEKMAKAKDIPKDQLDSLWQWASQIQ